MRKLSIPFILPLLVFFIPVNIYQNGNWITAGIQWALFRYQQNSMGTSLISLGNDIYNIQTGILGIKTVVSTAIWIFSAALLLFAICLILKNIQCQTPNPYRHAGLMIILAGCLFLVADILQYGFLFSANSSLCIPLGIPLIWIIGYWEYRYAPGTDTPDEEKSTVPFFESIPVFKKISSCYTGSVVFQELVILVVISVFIKFVVFTLSLFSPFVMFQANVPLYYTYVSQVLAGNIPYVDFSVEYPQFFFIPVLAAALPTLLLQGYNAFFASYLVVTCTLDIATLICVYLLAKKLFGQSRAFLCGLLYATAFSSAFFIPMTYDIFPAFLVMVSLLLFVYGRETSAYVSATAGALAKWFPVLCFPFFFLYALKNKNSLRPTRTGIIISAIIVIISIVPLYLLNPEMFLSTYTSQLNRSADSHGIIYYLDALCSSLLHIQPFVGFSFLILVIGEVALIAWYYRFLDEKQVTLCSVVGLSIFYFVLVNKIGSPSFIIWITPFLALFLVNSIREISLFYLVQVVFYSEVPVLLGIIWEPGKGYSVTENSLPSFAFLFYTVKFAVLILVMILIIGKVSRQCAFKKAGTS